MKKHLTTFLFITTMLCTEALAQRASISVGERSKASTGNSPAAFIYVSSTPPGASENEIEAFAASENGKLSTVAGSPFKENVVDMAMNGEYLFAVNANGFDIESYRIGSDGALQYVATTDASQAGDCNRLGPLFLDHTGATLYDMEFDGSGCANNTYESFTAEKSNGKLTDRGNSGANNWLNLPASFIGNNVYAYAASCIADLYWGIYGFKRSSSGLLTEINVSVTPPTPPTGYFYCPSQAAADPTDHVAISMLPIDQQNFEPGKPPQLAAYTADGEGNLSTTNTAATMPETSVGSVTDLNMSPSGKLLAVGGTGGLQIFHFNGPGPITHDTGLLTQDEIDQFFWDNQDHLYAISRAAGKLFVFTVTPTSVSQAPGSPYSISNPQGIIVQPVP
jgi:hypothetical protein